MNMKSVFPESTPAPFGRTDLKVHAWSIVTVLAAGVPSLGMALFHPDWSQPLKIAIALAPFAPTCLWGASVARWIRGLDELQRRIQSGALFFAAIGTLSITTAVNALQAYGVLKMDVPDSRFPVVNEEFQRVLQGAHGLGWLTTILLMWLLWTVGLALFNRRYQ
jgi:hypothetical protein